MLIRIKILYISYSYKCNTHCLSKISATISILSKFSKETLAQSVQSQAERAAGFPLRDLLPTANYRLAPHARRSMANPWIMAVVSGARCNRIAIDQHRVMIGHAKVTQKSRNPFPYPDVLPTEHHPQSPCYAENSTENSRCQIPTCSRLCCSRSMRTSSPSKPPSWSFPIGSNSAERPT